MTTRTLLVLCLVLAFVECAQAQPASAASASTSLATTPDTACGGEAGTGKRVGVDGTVTLTAAQTVAPPIFVGSDGYWTRCPVVAPPPPPKACPGSGRPVEWTVGAHTCTTARLGTTPASWLQQTIQSGRSQILRQQFGSMRGTLIERCDAGVRSVVSATCAPATHCHAGWYTQSFAGVRHTLTDRLPVGEYGQAAGSDGSALRVQCVAGTVKPAPQCVAGQQVTQRYSGGPIDPVTGKHLGDIRVYEYTGQPIDPGQLVTLTQIEGRTKPDGSPRKLVARCNASGRLQ